MKYIFQIIGFVTTVIASAAVTFFYVQWSNKTKAGQNPETKIEVDRPTTQAPTAQMSEITPISYSVEKQPKKAVRKAKPVKSVTYSTPKKVASNKSVLIEKQKPVLPKKVAPTKKQVRKMVSKAAEKERLYYSASPETKAYMKSLIQFQATDNNVPFEVQRAKPSLKISGAGMSDLERQARANVEKEKD